MFSLEKRRLKGRLHCSLQLPERRLQPGWGQSLHLNGKKENKRKWPQVVPGKVKILGKNSSPVRLSSTGTGCSKGWLSHHPWRYLKDPLVWQLGTWFSGGLPRAELMVGLTDFKCPFHPKLFYYSVILCIYVKSVWLHFHNSNFHKKITNPQIFAYCFNCLQYISGS